MSRRPTGFGRALAVVLAASLGAATAAGCGKKGPPLPPLVRTPAPPAGFTAERVGGTVQVRFTVPTANTDGTRPANIQRVDVYAFTGDVPLTDAQMIRYATPIASIEVKGPSNPNDVIEPDDPPEDLQPPQGAGLDQGAPVVIDEPVTAASYIPVDRPPDGRRPTPEAEGPQPLVVSAPRALMRTYVAVGVTTRGRPGSWSERVAVPLSPPPAAPARPSVTYDEEAVTVEWPVRRAAAEDETVLPSRWLGTPRRSIAYHVYETTHEGAATRLTSAPTTDGTYQDTRLTWGVERCYDVRAVEVVSGVAIESLPSPEACVTLTDTFPPAAPAGLTAVGTAGVVNLIWEASPATDVAGYIVLRGASEETLSPLTPTPIRDTTFRDSVEPGARRVYAVRAVDQAGNESPLSPSVEEAAR